MGNAKRYEKVDIVNNTKATQFFLMTLFDFNGVKLTAPHYATLSTLMCRLSVSLKN